MHGLMEHVLRRIYLFFFSLPGINHLSEIGDVRASPFQEAERMLQAVCQAGRNTREERKMDGERERYSKMWFSSICRRYSMHISLHSWRHAYILAR